MPMQPTTDHQPVAVENPRTDEEDLSEEQIELLLQEAEVRLRDAASRELNIDLKPLPKIQSKSLTEPYIQDHNGIAYADSARLVDDEQRKLSSVIRRVEPTTTKRNAEKPTAGQEWYDLPRTTVTPQFKRDLQLLQMRSVLDPHRHYKKSGKMKVPAFSQVGTVIEGPTEYYSARINKKDRKRSFVDEVMAKGQENLKFKRKYNDIQAVKRSGKKEYYKTLMAKRGRKT